MFFLLFLLLVASPVCAQWGMYGGGYPMMGGYGGYPMMGGYGGYGGYPMMGGYGGYGGYPMMGYGGVGGILRGALMGAALGAMGKKKK